MSVFLPNLQQFTFVRTEATTLPELLPGRQIGAGFLSANSPESFEIGCTESRPARSWRKILLPRRTPDREGELKSRQGGRCQMRL
jgi:hypothetical protein